MSSTNHFLTVLALPVGSCLLVVGVFTNTDLHSLPNSGHKLPLPNGSGDSSLILLLVSSRLACVRCTAWVHGQLQFEM